MKVAIPFTTCTLVAGPFAFRDPSAPLTIRAVTSVELSDDFNAPLLSNKRTTG